MGLVWRGVHRDLQREVAVKVDVSKTSNQSLFDELRLMASLSHRNIVELIDHGTVHGHPELPEGASYLVLELCRGLDLDQRPPETWEELKHVIEGMLAGLAYAHARGVVHRDLKPGNVLFDRLTESITETTVKLTDFGIAARLEAGVGQGQAGAGTPRYMAPEQIESDWRSQGPWTDMYALGLVIWKMAAGRFPFPSQNRFQLMHWKLNRGPRPFEPRMPVPRELGDWLHRMVAKEPENRPAFAAHALAELRSLGPPIGAHRGRVIRPETQRTRSDSVAVPTAPNLEGSRPLPTLNLWGLRPIPLVDRVKERATLWTALQQCIAQGRSRAVVLQGAPGTGKTKLVDWLVERAHREGLAMRLKAVHSRDRDAQHGLIPMVERALVVEGLEVEALADRLGTTLGVTPLAQDLLALLTRRHRFDAQGRLSILERWLKQRAANLPQVVVLEDVQWEGETLELVERVLAGEEGHPILFLLTARDTDLALRTEERRALRKLSSRERVERLEVTPLEPRDHQTLVESLLGFSGALAERLAERTVGNPLLAVQLVGHWVESGALRPAPHGLELVDDSLAIPADLLTVWQTRLDRILRDEEDQRAMEMAAALGVHVEEAAWLKLCAASGIQVEGGLLGRWVRRRLMRVDPREPGVFHFAHGLLREALIERAQRADRWSHLNLAIVGALEGTGADPERLARHYLEAGDLDLGLHWLLQALDHLVSSSRYSSERLLEEAYEVQRELDPPASDERIGQLWLYHAGLLFGRRDFEDAGRIGGRLLKASRMHGWKSLEGKALRLLGKLQREQGDYDRALETLLDAEAQLHALGLYDRCLDCWIAAGDVMRAKGRLDEAEEAYLHAVSLIQRDMETRYAIQPHQALATLALARGDVDGGLAHVGEAEAVVEGWMLGARARLANTRGELERKAGRPRQAAAAYREAATLWGESGSSDVVYPLLNVAMIDVEAGRHQDAYDSCTRLMRRLDGLEIMELYTRSILVPCCAALNKRAELEEHLTWMYDFIEGRSFANGEMLALLRTASEHLDPGSTASGLLDRLTDLLATRLQRARKKKS